MKYIPEKMIKSSRFSDLYSASDSAAKRFVAEKISGYISENAEYCDKNNYGHLCNLFSELAFEEFFEQSCAREEAIEKVKAAMYKYLKPMIAKMQGLSENPFFIQILKLKNVTHT